MKQNKRRRYRTKKAIVRAFVDYQRQIRSETGFFDRDLWHAETRLTECLKRIDRFREYFSGNMLETARNFRLEDL